MRGAELTLEARTNCPAGGQSKKATGKAVREFKQIKEATDPQVSQALEGLLLVSKKNNRGAGKVAGEEGLVDLQDRGSQGPKKGRNEGG